MEVKIANKEYKITELKYTDLASVAEMSQSEINKKLIMMSTDMSEDDYNNLTLKDGVTIQMAVMELNGLDGLAEGFQKPLKD